MYFVYLIINQKIFRMLDIQQTLIKEFYFIIRVRGAKYTKGSKWKLIYCKKYKSKSKALQEEYKLKKNRKLRNLIKKNYLNYNQSG